MASMTILGHGASLRKPKATAHFSTGVVLKQRKATSISFTCRGSFLPQGINSVSASHCFRSSPFRIRAFQREDASDYDEPAKQDTLDNREKTGNAEVGNLKNEDTTAGSWFLLVLAIAVGAAVVYTIISVVQQRSSTGSFFGIRCLTESSASSVAIQPVGFSLKFFGYKIFLPAYLPGWIYFWLLMAAGCGLFISEEALNIWVGITLSRTLTLDGTWQSFVESLSRNASHITFTFFWVYWGVCISDMIPFYVGKLFRQSGASDDVCSKLGIGEEKVSRITRSVQKYGNLMGFVERFSLGVRNPTAFLAGALGVSPECFFAGVCCGGLITLTLQLFIGFLLRERPTVALATVASVVGAWTIFPYAMAASTALFLYLQRRVST